MDENLISDYAKDAADWAKNNSIITGKEGNLLDLFADTKRAEAAEIFMRYLQQSPEGKPESNPQPQPGIEPEPTPEPDPEPDKTDILVSYFSATNNTRGVAQRLAKVVDGDLFEIIPADPYTSQDLDYYSGGRCDQENEDESARPEIADKVDHMEDYETIFLGYPIWFGKAPKIIYTFVESYDLNGKIIVPFCTSGSSPIGSSAKALEPLAEGARFLAGQRFNASVSESKLEQWVHSLDL